MPTAHQLHVPALLTLCDCVVGRCARGVLKKLPPTRTRLTRSYSLKRSYSPSDGAAQQRHNAAQWATPRKAGTSHHDSRSKHSYSACIPQSLPKISSISSIHPSPGEAAGAGAASEGMSLRLLIPPAGAAPLPGRATEGSKVVLLSSSSSSSKSSAPYDSSSSFSAAGAPPRGLNMSAAEGPVLRGGARLVALALVLRPSSRKRLLGAAVDGGVSGPAHHPTSRAHVSVHQSDGRCRVCNSRT